MNLSDTMTLELSEEALAVKRQLDEDERVLKGYESDLNSVNAEIEQMLEKSHEFDVLSRICRSLEELDELGAAELFWDQDQSEETRQARLRYAHEQIDRFGADIIALEKKRDSILDQIDDKNLALDYLHYDFLDAAEREERRRRAWVVERDADDPPVENQVMPWRRDSEEDQRFRRSLAASVLLCVITGWLLSIIDLPIRELTRLNKVPERVANLVREEMRPPPPAPVEEQVVPDEEIPEPEPELAE